MGGVWVWDEWMSVLTQPLQYIQMHSQSHQQQLIHEATLQNKYYTYTKLQPTAYFWKQLTATNNSNPVCLVPDTLVLNEKDMQIMWVYTDASGRMKRDTNVHFKDFVNKITLYSSPNQLVAILKRPISSQKLTYSNDIKLLNSRYLQNLSPTQISQKQQTTVLQRYIKSSGPKPFLCRTIHSTTSNSLCYLITNTRNFYDQGEVEAKKYVARAGDRATVVRSAQGRNLGVTDMCLKGIVAYMVFFRGVQIEEIVGDFLKDQTGNWWLVNIKAFKVIQKLHKNPKTKPPQPQTPTLQQQRYQKTKPCRYCQKNYLQSSLLYKMTMRMIIEMDKYLLHMGKEFGWLKRSDISNIDSYILYQEHRVCARCFRLYGEIQELMAVQRRFLEKQGWVLPAHPKELIFSQTNQQHLRQQAKNKQIHRLHKNTLPETIELGPNTNITLQDNHPIKNDQIINKMIRFRFIVYLNQIDQVVGYDRDCYCYLEFVLFGKKTKYKIALSHEDDKVIPLHKLKVFYFFAHSVQNLEQEYIRSNPSFLMHIITEHKQTKQRKIKGHLQLSFKDLIIPINGKKDFYKFFHIDNVSYGWGLEGSIGIIPSEGEVTTAKISFEKSEGKIYIPNENFYYCEALSQEWIDLIKAKNQRSLMRASNLTYKHSQNVNELSLVRSSQLQPSEKNDQNSKVEIEQEQKQNSKDETLHRCSSLNQSQMNRKKIDDYLFREIERYQKGLNVAKKKKQTSSRLSAISYF